MKSNQKQWNKRRIMIVGMARSGIASTDLLLEEGAFVIINDSQSEDALSDVAERYRPYEQQGQLKMALGQNPMDLLDGIDMIVLSPAVPLTAPFAQEAKRRGIEVIGEIELGYRFAKALIIAITGTNGKTTTTALTGALFKAAGKNTYVLGNIGLPITAMAKETKEDDVIVAEVAGFQLESTLEFHTPCCAVLNIREDHLDRFGSMENYIASKEMIFRNQTETDLAVLNADDPIVCKMGEKTKAQKLYFSRQKTVDNGAFLRDSEIIYIHNNKEEVICKASELKIPGDHNVENALASVCMAMSQGLDAKDVARGLREFPGVEHRIELVLEKEDIRYYNDSKGTNPDSTIKAVEAMDRPTVLILGGSNKNSDYCPVFEAFGGRIKAVVALGETRGQILRDANKTQYKAIYVCDGSFEEAVDFALGLVEKEENLLLSPACASYDMFHNFEERGRFFKQLILERRG